MATARNKNFDYLLEMHCTLYINPGGFINPEAHIEVFPELQFPGLYSQGCTFWASTYFQNWTSVSMCVFKSGCFHKLILRELSENKLEKIWYNKQVARNHDIILGWRTAALRAWLWHCMCVCVCDTTVLIICSSAAAAAAAAVGALQVQQCRCRVLLWHSHS